MFKTSNITDYTVLYRFGKPFDTEAVVNRVDDKMMKTGNQLPFFKVKQNEKEITLSLTMDSHDVVYGLGQQLGTFNRRGKMYRMYNSDDPIHTEDKSSLYGTHPFFIIEQASQSSEKKSFAAFIDFPGEMLFDIGFTQSNQFTITISRPDFDLYVMEVADKQQMVKEYLTLTGKPYLPPKWAFGFQQCRWSYPDAEAIQRIADHFEQNGIPCSAIYMDIDYMDNYKVFTIDESKFPDFAQFVQKLQKKGIQLVPIIDPGVRIEPGFSVYEEGIKNQYFCLDEEKKPFTAAVWPGYIHFPDFLNPQTQKWWGNLYQFLIAQGIEGIWNDMNEPSIFFTPEELKETQKKIGEFKELKNCWDFFSIKDKMCRIDNKQEYYQQFYHQTKGGETLSQDDLHNLYGYYMSKATAEGFKRLRPGQRYFLLSRSSYSGMHRFAAIWMGDNASWWSHIGQHIQMLMSLNLCGFFYTGADVGGFSCDASAELIIRWMQMAVFSPLYRNHSALGTRHQEPFAFDEESNTILKNTIQFRYSLLPYFYSEFAQSVRQLKPFIQHLSLVFSDADCQAVEDQFMVGESIMAAPIHQANSRGRSVFLPDVNWLYLTVKNVNQYTVSVLSKGHHYIRANLSEIPIFLKENSLFALNPQEHNASEPGYQELKIIGFITTQAEYCHYDDDGQTDGYLQEEFFQLKWKVTKKGQQYEIELVNKIEHPKVTQGQLKITFEIYNELGEKWTTAQTF
ncbi:MAG: alpha-glucosidase [Spirochaetes bacterium]|nr:alpha-glucosidase [Spirochaetota bacterium]